jgi:hypothetical protein
MSAFPPKADIGWRLSNVRFVPKADIITHSMISSARASTDGGTVTPSTFAVLRLTTNSYFVEVKNPKAPAATRAQDGTF